MNLYPPGKRACARAAITLLVSLFIIIVTCQLPATHAAVTFTVNSLLDTPDVAPGDGACANANGACTLRAAIQEANDTAGADQIRFNIGGTASVKTITPTSALPTIAEQVSINGYSQTGRARIR